MPRAPASSSARVTIPGADLEGGRVSEFREMLARYWPEWAGAGLVVAFLGKYAGPPAMAGIKRLWGIHVGFDARITKLEAEARELRAAFNTLDEKREEMTMGAVALATRVDGLVARFEDVRRTMAEDLRELRDETRETLKRTDDLVRSLADLVSNIRADHSGYADALRDSEARLRVALREEFERAKEARR